MVNEDTRAQRNTGRERLRNAWYTLRREPAAIWYSVRRSVTDAGPERETAVQSLKAAGAALLAWAVAGVWWDAPMALLAPWTAMFMVQSTVYRSLLSAVQQFAVVVIGTLLAAGAAMLTHGTMAAMALALPLTMLLGNYARFGTQGLNAPTAALFVLAYGSYSGFDIVHRFLETLLGAVIGVCVNAFVLPPVYTRSVRRLRTRLPAACAELLHEVADEVREPYDRERARGWYDRAERLTDMITDLRSSRRWSDESRRLNPGLGLRRALPTPPSADWDMTWDRMTEHIRTTMRSLGEPVRRDIELPAPVPRTLSALLRRAGDVCALDDRSREPQDERDADERARARERACAAAMSAHRRLTTVLADPAYAAVPALAGISADTRLLLEDVAEVAGWSDSESVATTSAAGTGEDA
ncbi:hypothetical protein GCM10010358_47430 [Streptomyces minutiscleroticus]|uniref:Integral membrane bound transporter domain-containing protein n=1 Tax=Streptomyces minutiscleroticus TaxID=68238 RepID=A0A918NQZ4_9ACTN|nr:hypothetical protein GCM10010358_47430 [Streptomyces minutiscleroticus]